MTLVLTEKAKKLMKLCEVEGCQSPFDFIQAIAGSSVCPAICMTEGCDHAAKMEPDQTEGYCDVCGGNTLVSALILTGFHWETGHE